MKIIICNSSFLQVILLHLFYVLFSTLCRKITGDYKQKFGNLITFFASVDESQDVVVQGTRARCQPYIQVLGVRQARFNAEFLPAISFAHPIDQCKPSCP